MARETKLVWPGSPQQAAIQLLDANEVPVGGLSSVGSEEVFAAFLVHIGEGRLAFKSRSASAHMKRLLNDSACGAVLWWEGSTYEAKMGVQLKGRVREVADLEEIEAVTDAYGRRFSGSTAKLPESAVLLDADTPSRFFVLDIDRFKVIWEEPTDNHTTAEYEPWLA